MVHDVFDVREKIEVAVRAVTHKDSHGFRGTPEDGRVNRRMGMGAEIACARQFKYDESIAYVDKCGGDEPDFGLLQVRCTKNYPTPWIPFRKGGADKIEQVFIAAVEVKPYKFKLVGWAWGSEIRGTNWGKAPPDCKPNKRPPCWWGKPSHSFDEPIFLAALALSKTWTRYQR